MLQPRRARDGPAIPKHEPIPRVNRSRDPMEERTSDGLDSRLKLRVRTAREYRIRVRIRPQQKGSWFASREMNTKYSAMIRMSDRLSSLGSSPEPEGRCRYRTRRVMTMMKRYLMMSVLVSILGLVGCDSDTVDSDDVCQPGTRRCDCYDHQSCNEGLSCVANTCVRLDSGADSPDGTGDNSAPHGCRV